MANRYWVGGNDIWGDVIGTKWAATSGGAGGASIPTSADDVFFDAASGAATVTIFATNFGAKSITCTGFTGTLAGTGAISVAGSITLVVGMTYTYSGTITLTATGTLTTAGKTTGSVTMNGISQVFSLGSALTSTGTITLTRGTFTTTASNYAVNALAFVTSGTSTKVVTMNGSTFTLSSGGTPWGIGSATGTTVNAGTSTINLTGIDLFFIGGGFTYNIVAFTTTSVSIGTNITGTNTFNSLRFTAPTSGINHFLFANNQTTAGLVFTGTAPSARVFLCSDTLRTARTLSVGSVPTLSDIDFRDITAAGTSVPSGQSWTGTRLGDCGGNTKIAFSAAKTVYWNLGGGQNWSATAWATTSGGTPAVNNFPLAQDTAVFNNAGSAPTVTITNAWNIGTIDMSTRTSSMTLTLSGTGADIAVYGNWITGSGITYGSSATPAITFCGTTAQTLTTAGKSFMPQGGIDIDCVSLTLQDAYSSNSTSTSAIRLTRGTFDANGYNVTLTGSFGSFSSSVKTLATGSGTWTIGVNWTTTGTNTTVTGTAVISLTRATAKQFTSVAIAGYSGITINQGGSGVLEFANSGDGGEPNTFANLSNTYSATGATTITFGTDQTFLNFTATGTAGKVLTINSTTNGAARTLTKTSGVVGVNYLSIRDSTATGGAAWYAGANSTNVSNNTGWIFANAPAATGNFFFLF